MAKKTPKGTVAAAEAGPLPLPLALNPPVAGVDLYKPVINHEESYNLWPAAARAPRGWRSTRFRGSYDECVAFIRDAMRR